MLRMTRREKRARRALDAGLLAALAIVLALLLMARCHGRPRGPPGAPDGLARRYSVDLATAPAWELELVPGIGRARAHAILSLRERDDGPGLRTLDDLTVIRGIGSALVRRLRSPGLPVRLLLHGRPAPSVVH